MYGMVQIILIYNGPTTIYIFKITTIYYIQKWLSLNCEWISVKDKPTEYYGWNDHYH